MKYCSIMLCNTYAKETLLFQQYLKLLGLPLYWYYMGHFVTIHVIKCLVSYSY